MRVLLVFLMVLNIVFFLWSHSPYALGDRDPGRAAREVQPQAVVITPAPPKAAAQR